MSTLKTTNLQHASATSPAIVLASDSTATAQLSSINGGPLSGARNRVINGDMRIDQRNAGASVSVTSNVYTLDRWTGGGSNDGTLTFQRVADGATGFTNSLKITVSTADSSLSANQYARVQQIIEGFNVADLAGGTLSPATITLSFWIKSSVTGTYGGHIASGDESRVYVFQYTVNAANTWEYKSVTVTLPTSGTWATDNSAGMRLTFSLGSGSSYINTANTWLTSYAQQASGNVNLINTLNATWQITGVQLEAGSVATPFERRMYGQELALCQRYYYRVTSSTNQKSLSSAANAESATAGSAYGVFPVTMRTAPTALEQTGTASNYQIRTGGTDRSLSAVPTFSSLTNDSFWKVDTTVASGQSAGAAGIFYSTVTSAYLGWSVEL